VVDAEDKLRIAFHLIEDNLGVQITDITLLIELGRIKVTLTDGNVVYVQYNDFDEYAYVVRFSYIIDDICRFDNFDHNWNVSTIPHHFHPRHKDDGLDSPMTGDPEKDIYLFCHFIKSGFLKDDNFKPI
jgi:hypothetical protein